MSRNNLLWRSPIGILLSGVLGLKRQRREADHSSPPSAEFVSSYTFVVRTGKDSFRSP
jgi:cytochrome c-type biogenesis protein CcmH/NrfF